MKNGLLAVVSMQSLTVSAFFSTLPKRCSDPSKLCREQKSLIRAATATPPTTDAEVQVKTEVPVSRISVCAGDLCQCQGEQYEYTGGAADAAIEALQGLGLPFPVDEVGCLGACGMGTMVAIDFENGDSIMTDGLESTLLELGIQAQNSPTAASETDSKAPGNGAVTEAVSGYREDAASEAASSIPTMSKPEKPLMLADARDRMRLETVDEVENPWVNMAAYLAKKATGKLLGDSSK